MVVELTFLSSPIPESVLLISSKSEWGKGVFLIRPLKPQCWALSARKKKEHCGGSRSFRR